MAETVLITGATVGIGYELAHLFARDGDTLVLVARGRDKLDEVAKELRDKHGVTAHVFPNDLSHRGAADDLIRDIDAAGLVISTLVNNAGFGSYGFFHESDADTAVAMIELNVISLVVLTRRLLDRMVAGRHGRILNVASVAGFPPGPLMAVYYATKAFVVSFSVAIANELKRKGVTVTVLCPGATKTAFQDRAGMNESPLFGRGVMDARTVAAAGHRACRRGQMFCFPGVKNWLAATAGRLVPMRLAAKVSRMVQETRTPT